MNNKFVTNFLYPSRSFTIFCRAHTDFMDWISFQFIPNSSKQKRKHQRSGNTKSNPKDDEKNSGNKNHICISRFVLFPPSHEMQFSKATKMQLHCESCTNRIVHCTKNAATKGARRNSSFWY